jgi:hypothetical protein
MRAIDGYHAGEQHRSPTAQLADLDNVSADILGIYGGGGGLRVSELCH